MKATNSLALIAAIGAATAFYSVAPASAAIVCSGNECWHTKQVYEYPPSATIVVHPNEWKWGANDHFKWREHEGRGYWNSGEWRTF